jgi:putative ABC transport system permease protein
MDHLLSDLRFAVRMLAKRPLQTAVAVIALAIGIGANTAIFSVVHAALLEPLPYPEANHLVVVWGNHPDIGDEAASAPDYNDWREQSRSFADMGAMQFASLNLSGDGEPERLVGVRAQASVFSTLGAAPALGRYFTPEEDVPNGPRVVVLAHDLWERRYGASPEILGRSIQVNGHPHVVVGVMPKEMRLPLADPSLAVPLGLDPSQFGRRADFLGVIGRLAPGIAIDEAQAEMTGIAARLTAQYPATNTGWTVRLVGLHDEIVKDARLLLLVLLGAVALLLLIACANVANLQLARAATRHREIAVRAALGAARSRIVAQLLTEGLLLSLAGAAVGLLVAPWVTDALLAMRPPGLDLPDAIPLNRWVLLFTAALAVATGLVFGLAPALHLGKTRLAETLKEGSRSVAGDSRRWLRGALVVAQVGLALVLLVGVGLLVRSFNNLVAVDLGFDASRTLMAGVTLPESDYPDAARRVVLYDQAREAVVAIPGVRSVSVTAVPPLVSLGPQLTFTQEGAPASADGGEADASIRSVDPSFFASMSVPVLAGRSLAESDRAGTPNVVVINEKMARQIWPQGDAIGRRIAFDGTDDGPTFREIVGIVGDVRQDGPSEPEYRGVYVPYAQRPTSTLFFLVKSDVDAAALAQPVRQAVSSIDPKLPLFAVRTLDEVLSRSLAPRTFATSLFGAFGSVALLLAALGLYSVVAYVVAQQTREIGIRMALGATWSTIVGLVLRRGGVLVAAGVVAGGVVAAAAGRLIESMLFDVSPFDPVAFAAAAAALTVAALAACIVPARRAARIDPMEALRHE